MIDERTLKYGAGYLLSNGNVMVLFNREPHPTEGRWAYKDGWRDGTLFYPQKDEGKNILPDLQWCRETRELKIDKPSTYWFDNALPLTRNEFITMTRIVPAWRYPNWNSEYQLI